MEVRENIPILELTTMRLGGKARFVLVVETPEDVKKAHDFAKERNLPTWFMGGGANTIGRDGGFDGVVILNKIKGIFVKRDGKVIPIKDFKGETDEAETEFVGMGGEVWDDFVKNTAELGYSGIEAMSAIPGTVGAAPVQNIGAYGQDLAQVVTEVEVFDAKDNNFKVLKKHEMNLGYRCTRFNCGEDAGRFFVISVTVRLKKDRLKPPFYNSLQRKIDENGETDFSPKNIRRLVTEIRESKLPDPELIASAGSFFKNVYLDKAGADVAEAKGIPVWRNADGTGKINSGWLIENCGLKGQELYGFRISDKAALVLINETAESYNDLKKARQKIIETVKEKFGYTIEQEPVEIGSNKE